MTNRDRLYKYCWESLHTPDCYVVGKCDNIPGFSELCQLSMSLSRARNGEIPSESIYLDVTIGNNNDPRVIECIQ